MEKRSSAPCLIFCYLAYTSVYISRINLSMAGDALKSGGILNTAQIGTLGLVFSVIYACGRLFNGTLSDRIRPWILISVGLSVMGTANIFFSFLPGVLLMTVLWGVNAYGQSMLWSSILKTISAVSPAEKVKSRSAVMVTTVATGNLAAILINAVLVTRLGVRFAFLVPGALNLLLVLPIVLLLRGNAFTPAEVTNPLISVRSLLRDRQVRRMLIPAMLHGFIKDNVSLWMAVYFVDTFGIDLQKSSWFLLLIPAMGLLGRLGFNPVMKALGNNENRVSLLGFLLCTVSAAILVFCHSPILAAVLLSLIYAAVSMSNTTILSIFPLNYSAAGQTGTVSGMMDTATYLGAGLGSLLYGQTITYLGYNSLFVSWIIIGGLCILAVAGMLKKSQLASAR